MEVVIILLIFFSNNFKIPKLIAKIDICAFFVCVNVASSLSNVNLAISIPVIFETLSYTLKDSFGLKVNKVNVHVDGIRMER